MTELDRLIREYLEDHGWEHIEVQVVGDSALRTMLWKHSGYSYVGTMSEAVKVQIQAEWDAEYAR